MVVAQKGFCEISSGPNIQRQIKPTVSIFRLLPKNRDYSAPQKSTFSVCIAFVFFFDEDQCSGSNFRLPWPMFDGEPESGFGSSGLGWVQVFVLFITCLLKQGRTYLKFGNLDAEMIVSLR